MKIVIEKQRNKSMNMYWKIPKTKTVLLMVTYYATIMYTTYSNIYVRSCVREFVLACLCLKIIFAVSFLIYLVYTDLFSDEQSKRDIPLCSVRLFDKINS